MRGIGVAGLGIVALAACAHPVPGTGPAGIPFACAGGKAARIFYEGGGYFPRGTARLEYDGHDYRLSAVPPTYGLRYVSDPGAAGGPIIIWSVRGEEAWIGALDPGRSDEREIAHCTRVRQDG